MYQPTTAASTATIVPASSALTMNGNVNSSLRSVIGFERELRVHFTRPVRAGGRGGAGPRAGRRRPGGRRAVRSTSIGVPYRSLSVGRGDHLLDRAADRAAAGHVDHLVEVAEQRVDVVGDEQHRRRPGSCRSAAGARRPRPGWGGRGCRAARRGSAARGSRTSACAISSRCCSPPDSSPIGRGRSRWRRPARSPRRPGRASARCRSRAALRDRDRDAPAGAVEPEPHEVDPADPGRGVEAVALGEVADRAARLGRRAAEHGDRARLERDQPEDHPHQRRLAGAVGPEHGDELPAADRAARRR